MYWTLWRSFVFPSWVVRATVLVPTTSIFFYHFPVGLSGTDTHPNDKIVLSLQTCGWSNHCWQATLASLRSKYLCLPWRDCLFHCLDSSLPLCLHLFMRFCLYTSSLPLHDHIFVAATLNIASMCPLIITWRLLIIKTLGSGISSSPSSSV